MGSLYRHRYPHFLYHFGFSIRTVNAIHFWKALLRQVMLGQLKPVEFFYVVVHVWKLESQCRLNTYPSISAMNSTLPTASEKYPLPDPTRKPFIPFYKEWQSHLSPSFATVHKGITHALLFSYMGPYGLRGLAALC